MQERIRFGKKTRDLSSLTKCYGGGAPIAPSITEQFKEKFGIYVHNAYGLTESASPPTSCLWGSGRRSTREAAPW